MIRFSAQGAYLLLVPQRRTLIRDRALISILRNNQMFNVRDLKLGEHVPMKLSFLIFAFLQKARSENEMPLKVNGSRRLENGLVVPGSFLAKTTSRAIATKFEEEIIRLKNLLTHKEIRPLFLQCGVTVRLCAIKWSTYPYSYVILQWGRLLTKPHLKRALIRRGWAKSLGWAYWKEGAKSRIITVITSKRSDKFRHWCGPIIC